MENGLALPYYTKVIELAGTDVNTNKSILIQAYGYIGAYQANVKKDFPVALENFEKIVQLDPGNADATKYIGILKKWIQTGSETTKASPGTASGK